jgi:hypothetical protein
MCVTDVLVVGDCLSVYVYRVHALSLRLLIKLVWFKV